MKKVRPSCPYFVKKRPFSLEYPALMPVFCQKISILSKTQCSYVIFFFNIFMKNFCCNANIWSKNVNSVKITLLYEPKSQNDDLFFLFGQEKLTALIPRFSTTKKANCLKSTLLSSHILSKERLFSQKHAYTMLFFFK